MKHGGDQYVCVCVSSLLSGRISTLRDETGAVSIVYMANYCRF